MVLNSANIRARLPAGVDVLQAARFLRAAVLIAIYSAAVAGLVAATCSAGLAGLVVAICSAAVAGLVAATCSAAVVGMAAAILHGHHGFLQIRQLR